MEKYKTFLESTLKDAGELVKGRFTKKQSVKAKNNPADLVTQTDLEVHQLVYKRLREEFSDHGFISEEAPQRENGSNFTWILDPIDGTNNFAAHIPLFGIMLCLREKEEIIATGIYLPITDEYFSAQKDAGAYRNGKRISCSNQQDWEYSVGCSSANLNPEKQDMRDALARASIKHPFWLYCYGSAAVSGTLVAAGRRDWYLSKGSQLWDYAPVSLLLKEAGCKVTDHQGNEWRPGTRELLAANPALHQKLLDLL